MSTSDNIDTISDLEDAINTGWVLLCTALVFWEQAGFAMLEAGSIRAKNLQNILLKNILDVAIAGVGFYICGYAFSFGSGSNENSFIGDSGFFNSSLETSYDYANWFFQWSFAATAATTVSGCMAERTSFECYLFFSFFITVWIYAVPVHWVWADNGWLCAWNSNGAVLDRGMIDFAGSCLVHMIGGLAGMIGSYIVGPRIGVFDGQSGKYSRIGGHSSSLSTLGIFCLWFGWFGFNAGYTLALTNGMHLVAARIMVNTVICPAVCGIAVLLFEKYLFGVCIFKNEKSYANFWDLTSVNNGILAGLVSITGPCGVVSNSSSVIIAIIGGLIYCTTKRLLMKLQIDDPIDAIAIHCTPGMWGIIASGLFATKEYTSMLGYNGGYGLFYGDNGMQLAAQMIGLLSVIAWTTVFSALIFYILKIVPKKELRLRVEKTVEMKGNDVCKHGGFGYNFTDYEREQMFINIMKGDSDDMVENGKNGGGALGAGRNNVGKVEMGTVSTHAQG